MSYPRERSWHRKFADAFRGIFLAIRGQSSFTVHLIVASAVVCVAAWLEVSRIDWILLVLCIGMVFAAETLNSSLEHLARAIDGNYNPDLGAGLDMASGAVLWLSLAAAVIGILIFWPYWFPI